MVREVQRNVVKNPISLLLVEGQTDEIFYARVKGTYLSECRIAIHNLQGLYNINAKIINQIVNYAQQHRDEVIRVYCCLDRESRCGTTPEFDLKRIEKYIKDESIKRVLSIDMIRATPHIESWLFHDIDGIYGFLRVPKSHRKPKTFKPPSKFRL